jgi:hypothetical protein
MKALRPRFGGALSVAVLFIGAATPAMGLANRVFVSARSGNDANACDNINTPCQTFAGAVIQLNPGGEAIVLDSGGYGPVTITQPVTIEAPPGVLAFIHPPSGDAITVNAGSSDVVTLRGLVLNGGSGNGIIVNTVGILHVENCVISGFSSYGLYSSAAGSSLFINDTVVRENGSGVYLYAGRAAIDHCRLERNQGDGIRVEAADVTVRDSVSAGNTGNGFEVRSFGAEGSILNLDHCLSTNNAGIGFDAFVGGTGYVYARASNSSISENVGWGIYNFDAFFESLGNNFVRGNYGGDVNGTITVVLGQ